MTFKRMSLMGSESRSLFLLALPICGAQLAQAGMSVVDVMMTGRLDPSALAAVSVGSSLWMPLMFFMTGTLMGITPIVAYLRGGHALERVRPAVHQGLWMAALLGTGSAIVLWLAVLPVFEAMQVPAGVASLSADYLSAVAFGMPGIALFQALRAFSDGMNHTRPALWFSLIGLAVNIPANFVLIYGGDGLNGLLGIELPALLQELPALGAFGCGIATALSMWSMAIAMAIYTWRSQAYREVSLWKTLAWPYWAGMRELIVVGVPIGIAIFVEITLFTLIALFIASFGDITVAAHQVALSFTTVLFMLPMALSMALTVRVGNTLGQQRPDRARLVAWNGITLSVLVAVVNSLILLVLGDQVIRLYTNASEVQRLASSLLVLAAIYQLSDSLQANLAGALRGYKDTRVVMAITLFSYWVVGLGSGHWLGRHGLSDTLPAMGVQGYWVGLIAGLSTAALLLGWRLHFISQRE